LAREVNPNRKSYVPQSSWGLVVRLTTSHRKILLLWNLNRGGQGPSWAVVPLDGWMDGRMDGWMDGHGSISQKVVCYLHTLCNENVKPQLQMLFAKFYIVGWKAI
jgi:hypothetical protein